MFKVLILWVMMSAVSVQAAFVSPKVVLEDIKGVKVLVFLSEACPCSRSHVEHLNELVKEYSEISFYGVVAEPPKTDEQKRLKEEYFNQEGFSFPLVMDEEQKLVKKYKALKTPHITLLRNEEVLYQGGLTNQKSFKDSGKKYLAENLKLLKTGKPLKYKTGRSLGCYIRRVK